ncbi:MAG: hypothetical protein M1818_006060 [Claussenomyces sp. TS43310]|nr:MAG: hypothetical protein M1818_006060 [Claussenomyces sp. TS43310]
MSHLLWKHYLEDDVDKFESLLSNSSQSTHLAPKNYGVAAGYAGSLGAVGGSPGTGTSPRTTTKARKSVGHGVNTGGTKGQIILGRMEVNSRDQMGRTILHRAVSSQKRQNALRYAFALIDHPAIDLYIQDKENGWSPLHRALYFGNVTIARALMKRDATRGHGLIKIKDYEGNTAFDLYGATIAQRTLQHRDSVDSESVSDEDEASVNVDDEVTASSTYSSIDGDELFAFGSNKNLNLGFGDEDDRQYPERISLQRPDHLLHRFYREQFPSAAPASSVSDLPTLIRSRPIIIQDVCLSKLHSAVLTTDPEANLHICGFGPGGRLGTGDETTKFSYVCIEEGALAGKKIASVALGQNHTIAISEQGEIFTWGTNTWGQLGYSLPKPATHDEEPINSTPRQVFGPLKREVIVGIAASATHSVAHTSSSLYTWGKNEGQLGLMDSDSRSLEAQPVPRKVAASLFSTPIKMVSAINRATICLLANHSVCVFTNYGYNYVKFPLFEGFINYHLNSSTLTTRYEAESHICEITSGGDTVAAVSSHGDLFTFIVSSKLDPITMAVSTTNPAKIKNALSQPQLIWSPRKGHCDGIRSVGISENGSVIICTQAGAVWRRVKRAKIKDAFASGAGNFKKKDFKFQRVPGLTNIVAVRSNVFGSYAAIRRDCDVTKSQIKVGEQNLWKDLAPLLSFRGLAPSEPSYAEDSPIAGFWTPAIPKEAFEPLKRAVLVSPDLEGDVSHFLHQKYPQQEEFDALIFSSSFDRGIPVHSFMLAARSSLLRDALSEFRQYGRFHLSEFVNISRSDTGQLKIELQAVDLITLLNLVLYIYEDAVVDVWHFTRHVPQIAFRYRQVRTELMKVAAKLRMTGLETAVRLMITPGRSLHLDMAVALRDPSFMDSGDTIIELDGDEILVHSILLCQRCPFFKSLFRGRAGGQWLTSRREIAPDLVRIDMKHIDPSTFELVLRYLYADVGSELFDHVVSSDIDDFSEMVMDVLSVANELMLDRLSEICQEVIGRFVTTRNICQILNVIAPCAVTEFKDAGLEYLCLQLECMLENHLLDDLDEDLILELDDVVRSNQLDCLQFARSGRAELLLHERHPSLAGDLNEDRQRIVRDMAFRSIIRDDDHRLSSSYRARVGSVDELLSSSPQDKDRRRSKPPRNAPFSPAMRPQDSAADLMFDMDEEDSYLLFNTTSPRQASAEYQSDYKQSPTPSKGNLRTPSRAKGISDLSQQGLLVTSPVSSSVVSEPPSASRSANVSYSAEIGSSPLNAAPWSSTSSALPSSKLDMRDIMNQASMNRTSTLSLNLSAQRASEDSVAKAATKLSQRERKRQQQQALQPRTSPSPLRYDKNLPNSGKNSPWQVSTSRTTTSLKDILDHKSDDSPPKEAENMSSSPVPHLALSKRRTGSPDTRFAGQQLSNSTTSLGRARRSESSTPSNHSSRPGLSSSSSIPSPLKPHSKSYSTPAAKAEPSLQLSMADIIGQQQLEQDMIKEAVAKRSLQEIQEEQAFQEWWDQESRRAQEEEARRTQLKTTAVVENDNNKGRRSKNHRTGPQRGRGDSNQSAGRGRGRGRARGREQGSI